MNNSAALEPAPQANPWWRGAVIYEVYLRSFFDSNGDGVGDLPGVIAKLDYIESLGVDALWITPFFKSPMRDYGYDVSDYRTVDPMFGTDQDFDRLVNAAHTRGLKVIIDLELPHTSDQHPWFSESRRSRDNPKADWYVWADPKADGTAPNNWLSVFGGSAWQWDPRRDQYYLHHFLSSQPNLNWHSPSVVDNMLGEAEFWLERGVDGLRLDAITTLVHDAALHDNPPLSDARHMDFGGNPNDPFTYQEHHHDRDRPELMDRLARLRALTDRYPDRFLLAEVADVDSIAATAKYTRGRAALHSGYTFQLTRPALDLDRLRAIVGRFENEIDDGWATYAFGNHDSSRVVTRWDALPDLAGDRKRLAKLLMASLLSLRGSICIYQGEELGLTEADLPFEELLDPWGIEMYPIYKGRDGCRTPMPWTDERPSAGFSAGKPWLPLWHEHSTLSVKQQEVDPGSVLNAYRRFLVWRKTQPALVAGDKFMIDAPAPIYAFERRNAGERLLCAFNFSNQPAELTVTGAWQPIDGHGFEASFNANTISLPAFGAFFAESG